MENDQMERKITFAEIAALLLSEQKEQYFITKNSIRKMSQKFAGILSKLTVSEALQGRQSITKIRYAHMLAKLQSIASKQIIF